MVLLPVGLGLGFQGKGYAVHSSASLLGLVLRHLGNTAENAMGFISIWMAVPGIRC